MEHASAQDNFSIIVPTYQEASNIPELVKRISQIDFKNRTFEVILVDDNSRDGTVEMVDALSQQFPWLRLIVRQENKGYSQSLLTGFKQAKYPILITMDADLSHPPEKIPELLATLAEPETNMVIGSRYIPGGTIDNTWPLIRKIISRSAALMARPLLPMRVNDPLSGFMAFKSAECNTTKLKPISWRVGLEMMVKLQFKIIKEVPIFFSERTQGKSKLTIRSGLDYANHVMRLAIYKMFLAKGR